MKVINLFGEPSSGKSATMHSLAGKMKKMGLSVDVGLEFYKEMVYDNTPSENLNFDNIVNNTENQVKRFGGQLYVLAEQNKRLSRLNGTVDYVITDCPLPLIAYYTPQNYLAGFENMVINLFNTYDNFNIYVKKNHQFEHNARIHNEQQAMQIGKELPLYLKNFTDDIIDIYTSNIIEDEIINILKERNIIKNSKKGLRP